MVVFGASVTKMNLGQIVLINNKQIGYPGELYGVGSQEGDLNGVHVYTKVADLPCVPDVAIFLTPARTVPALMEECGQKGITHVVIESGDSANTRTAIRPWKKTCWRSRANTT